MTRNPLVPWAPFDGGALAPSAPLPEIVKTAVQLNERDQKALSAAFQSECCEMAASFAWNKALAALKKQLAGLGMEFVGEMLGRTDLSDASNPAVDVRDDEAVDLAEQLGMIRSAEAVRLRGGHTVVNHFVDPDAPPHEGMPREEAVSIVRSCVVSFLADTADRSLPRVLKLRGRLETERFDDADADALVGAPYFYHRTVLCMLLSQLKNGAGAPLDCAAANVVALLPALWPTLRDDDRWQAGEAYALVQAGNRRAAADALRTALMKVPGKGFSFVPETLRSNAFRTAARAVLTAHYGSNNVENEPKPLAALVKLGASIPGPAAADCLTAVLCIRLGDRYGFSEAAQPLVADYFRLLRPAQWAAYLDKALPYDRHLLEKLMFGDGPLERWQALVGELGLQSMAASPQAQALLSADPAQAGAVAETAKSYREQAMR